MKKISIIALVGFALLSCKKEDKYPEITVIGHGGSGIDISTMPYQENTIEAIEYALSYPEIAGVEIDIQWSKEGTAWLYHDEDLSTQTNGSGCVREHTDQELEALNYNGLQTLQLPRLNETAALLTGKKVFLDLKLPDNCGTALSTAEFENSLLSFQALLEDVEVSVIVQNLSQLAFFQALGWKVYLNVVSESSFLSTDNWEDCAGCCIRNEGVTGEEVDAIHAAGKEVIIFDARAPKPIRKALKKRPDYFLADDIKATLIEKIR